LDDVSMRARVLRRVWFVRVLEARFHPDSKSRQHAVVVGRVLCEGRTARIEPVSFPPEMVKPFEPIKLLDELEFVVGSAVGDTFHALVALRGDSWSFVEVPGVGRST
jgi:hypothetical protein